MNGFHKSRQCGLHGTNHQPPGLLDFAFAAICSQRTYCSGRSLSSLFSPESPAGQARHHANPGQPTPQRTNITDLPRVTANPCHCQSVSLPIRVTANPSHCQSESLPIRVTANPFTTHAHADEQAGTIPFDNTE